MMALAVAKKIEYKRLRKRMYAFYNGIEPDTLLSNVGETKKAKISVSL